MRELPIVFSAPMVKAILEGHKTQTRRVVKGTALEFLAQFPSAYVASPDNYFSPYGQPGDHLWAKEAWRAPASLDGMTPSQIGDASLDTGYCKPWAPIEYMADGMRNNDGWWNSWGSRPMDRRHGRYRNARFMPRWASRITLEITGVRIERLHDITISDCYAEGIDPVTLPDLAREAYQCIWTKTTGEWDANPWVWVIEFRMT